MIGVLEVVRIHAADLEPVQIGEVEVEQDHVGLEVRAQRLGSAGHRVGDVALPDQAPQERVARLGVALDHQ